MWDVCWVKSVSRGHTFLSVDVCFTPTRSSGFLSINEAEDDLTLLYFRF